MLAYGYIKGDWQQAVDLYTRQCSIGVNAQDLATMAATLAAAGKNPVTHSQVIDAAKVPNVLAVMSTAGLYDDSGKWLYHTGLPAKSGVGGGIIAVSPGKFGIAVIAPPLDEAGNSVKAQRAIEAISAALGGNPYGESQVQTTTVQVTSPPRPSLEIYGFAMLDMVEGKPATVHELKPGMKVSATKIVEEPQTEISTETVITGKAPK